MKHIQYVYASRKSFCIKNVCKIKVNLTENICTVHVSLSLPVTHVVSGCNNEGLCPRTIKYLQGVLSGRWIVNMECRYLYIFTPL